MDAVKEDERNGTPAAAMETEEGEIKEEGEEIEEGQVVEDEKMEESSKVMLAYFRNCCNKGLSSVESKFISLILIGILSLQ